MYNALGIRFAVLALPLASALFYLLPPKPLPIDASLDWAGDQ
jgi:hypothetical protein